jgi:hypothetical protein
MSLPMNVVENMDGDHLQRIWQQGENDGLEEKEKAKKVENKMRLMTDKWSASRMLYPGCLTKKRD